MTILFGDLETYCEADLKNVGPYVYAEDPSLKILLFAYAFDDGPVRVWDAYSQPEPPRELALGFFDANTTLCFHNSAFDRTVLNAVGWETDIRRWFDTMVLLYWCGLPGALDKGGKILGFSDDIAKMEAGEKLKQKFCKPQPKNRKVRRHTPDTAPEEWAEFVEYARQDVVAMRHIYHALPHWNVQDQELQLWHLDQRINDRGLPVDPEGAKAAIDLAERTVEELNEELYRVTEGKVETARQVEALRQWCHAMGVPLGDMKASTVEWAMAGKAPWHIPPQVHRALEIRQQTARTSTAKYQTILRSTSSDNRMRGTLQFYGAFRTGRWAGRRFQPHNLPRPLVDGRVGMDAIINDVVDLLFDLDRMSVTASCIRSAVMAPEGRSLLAGDLSNIEGRTLAWQAQERWKIQAFRDFDAGVGPDLYLLTYATSFGISVEDVTKDQRQVGKVQELALGYQGAVGAFQSMADNYGVDLPEARVVELVKAWRRNHPATVRYWYETEDAAVAAVHHPGRTFRAGFILWSARRHNGRLWLLARLPSGRFLCYFDPQLKQVTTEYGPKTQLTYMGLDTYTSKWQRVSTYGGKLVENLTQAIARDILAHAMPIAEARGFPIVGHVHDEIIAEAPDDAPGATTEALELCLQQIPHWAEGLPLAAEATKAKRYGKD